MSAVFPAWRRHLAKAFVGLGVCLAAFAACSSTPLGFQVVLPNDLSGQPAWIEIGAFKGAHCNAIGPMLANGVPDGATARIAFKGDQKAGPTLGNIPNGTYAFGAVARDENCTILATGCKEADVSSTDSVKIVLSTSNSPSGACPPGSSCLGGQCAPANDNSNPRVGAQCSLELLGAGPLVNPLAGNGTLMSAPAIAATSTGFVIAYRQVDASGTSARLMIMPIDDAGGALTTSTPGLPSRCEGTDETDGLGLIVDGTDAKITLARPACGAKPALELLNFKTTSDADPGKIVLGSFLISSSTTATTVALAPARPATSRPGGDLVVYNEGGTARIANVDPEKGIVGPYGSFGGTTGIKNAWVAANDKVLALLAAAPGRAVVNLDAGANDAGDAEAGVVTQPRTTADTELRLLVVPAGTAVDSIDAAKNTPRAPIELSGSWGSLATLGGRVIVLSDGYGSTGTASIRSYDLGNDSPSDTNDFALPDENHGILSGDVAALGNRAFFVALQEKTITLRAYDNATTTLTQLRDVSFANVPRISAIDTIRDGRVAVAVTKSRVAVAWTTATVLGKYDSAGGYAVFACTD
jgi:hypothetical protein